MNEEKDLPKIPFKKGDYVRVVGWTMGSVIVPEYYSPKCPQPGECFRFGGIYQEETDFRPNEKAVLTFLKLESLIAGTEDKNIFHDEAHILKKITEEEAMEWAQSGGEIDWDLVHKIQRKDILKPEEEWYREEKEKAMKKIRRAVELLEKGKISKERFDRMKDKLKDNLQKLRDDWPDDLKIED